MMLHIRLVQQKFARKWVLSDTNKRSLIKTISWRITGSGTTFLIAYLIIGNFAIAGIVGLIQFLSNTVLYFVHERVWNKIEWGKT